MAACDEARRLLQKAGEDEYVLDMLLQNDAAPEPGFGAFTTSAYYTAPGFSGFANPSIQRDLGLLYLATPLPAGVLYPSLQGSLQTGSLVTLAGFGRSGFGDYGYTTFASLTDRRTGSAPRAIASA